jgi:hypothetical protein
MPRNVRNFWVSFNVDGRDSKLESGPVSADGGFSGEILIRRDGCIDTAAILRGVAHPDGSLELIVTTKNQGEVLGRVKVESQR